MHDETQQQHLWVTVVSDCDALRRHIAAWDDLAANAIEPNVFYESWMLLPAVQAFSAGKNLSFVLVFAADPRREAEPLLCGMFPLERKRGYRGLPVTYWTLWDYGYRMLATPLVRRACEKDCLAAFCKWLATDPTGTSMIEFEHIAGDGAFLQALLDAARARGSSTFVSDSWERAFWRRGPDLEAYLERSLSAHKRRDLQRKQRRLMELGRLEYVPLHLQGDAEHWLEEFLRLEMAGWKGREGTALACKASDRDFFLTIAHAGLERKRLRLPGLMLDRRPIALRCNFVARPGSFFFKPAFDESYGQFSPGVLLEVENIRQLHADPEIEWMDSCTDPDNQLLNTMWHERRTIVSLVAATGKGMGNMLVKSLPWMRQLKRLLRSEW